MGRRGAGRLDGNRPRDLRTRSHGGGLIRAEYRHLVPSPDDWESHPGPATGRKAPSRGTLITDYSSYNTDLAVSDRRDPRPAFRAWLQPHWVGDLTVSLKG